MHSVEVLRQSKTVSQTIDYRAPNKREAIVSTMSNAETFLVNADWDGLLSGPLAPAIDLQSTEMQCQLVFTLILYLNLSIRDLLFFIFESKISTVKHRAGMFMAFDRRRDIPFAPAKLYKIWHDRFPRSKPHLHDLIIEDCANEIVLEESNAVINEKTLKIKLKHCTMESVTSHLNPRQLADKYRYLAPFTWNILAVFTTSPNRYRKAKERRKQRQELESDDEENEGIEDYLCEGPVNDIFGGEIGAEWAAQGSIKTIVLVISMMAITRNGATNLFAIVVGLFMEIGGTSSCVVSTFCNAGVY
ncbi:hypothetical protein BJ138DRAFT_1106182, partial [Hygrophoropsis aurantiaca]